MLEPIRSLLGLGEAEIVVSAAAPLPPEVGAFFAGLGLRILDVYGMTETTGAFTANTLEEFKLGTVGRPVTGTEVQDRRGRRDPDPRAAEHPRLRRTCPSRPPTCWTTKAGCTPATSASWTRTASCPSSTARRS